METTAKIKTDSRPPDSATVGVTQSPTVFDNNLREATDRLNQIFATALANADADGAARAALELDDAIVGWSGDTLQSDATDHARAVLRSMITRLAGAATAWFRGPTRLPGAFF